MMNLLYGFESRLRTALRGNRIVQDHPSPLSLDQQNSWVFAS